MYMTIALRILEDRPRPHARFRKQRKAPRVMENYARMLKANHGAWKEPLGNQGLSESQIAGEAMEMAIKNLLELLPEWEVGALLSLDEATVPPIHAPPA